VGAGWFHRIFLPHPDYYSSMKLRILYLCPIYLTIKCRVKKSLKRSCSTKVKWYTELVKREGRESTARDIPVESYVYAYLKAIDSA
jgi:hypothetical protein